MTAYGPQDLIADLDVSRETLDRLLVYEELLRRWQKRINLVSSSTLPDFWRRHALDSAQLAVHAGTGRWTWLDLGSGAGFPGLVLAILLGSGIDMHLVESDRRKCAFLHQVAQATDTPVTIHPARIEAVEAFPADVITARALAPLGRVLEYARPFTSAGTRLLFPKGQDVEREIAEASRNWSFDLRTVPSRSDPSGRIVIIDRLAHV